MLLSSLFNLTGKTALVSPAIFYMLSAPAHQIYPVTLLKKEQAIANTIGSLETSNHRTVYKYIHADGIKSAQLQALSNFFNYIECINSFILFRSCRFQIALK